MTDVTGCVQERAWQVRPVARRGSTRFTPATGTLHFNRVLSISIAGGTNGARGEPFAHRSGNREAGSDAYQKQRAGAAGWNAVDVPTEMSVTLLREFNFPVSRTI